MGICELLLAKNESDRIKPCLESLKWVDQIVVVIDASTSDDTANICEQYGAEVILQPWLGYAAQLRVGLDYVKQDWILRIDADERVTIPLQDEIIDLLSHPSVYSGFDISSCNLLWGKKMRAYYPDRHLRLFLNKAGTFPDKAIHEHWVPFDETAKISHLKGDLLHDSYRSLSHYVQKNIKYAELSAFELVKKSPNHSMWMAIGDGILTFIKYYILKAGFLDGMRGLTYCMIHAYYMYLRHAIAYEICQKNNAEKK